MIDVTHSDIRKLFDKRLIALLPKLELQGSDVAWPNAAFKPAPARAYIRPYLMPAAGGAATLGPDCMVRLSGIYQISIFEPKGEGQGHAERRADALLQDFPLGMTLPCCGQWVVVTNAYLSPFMEEEERLHYPISIAYECYARQKQGRQGP